MEEDVHINKENFANEMDIESIDRITQTQVATGGKTIDNNSSDPHGESESEHGSGTKDETSRREKRMVEGDSNSSNFSTKLANDHERNPSKISKLEVEPGSWKCMKDSCNAQDDENMFTCKKCKYKYHYRCTDLPLYQIALFLSPNHRGYQCGRCVKIPENVKAYSKQDFSDMTTTELEKKKVSLEKVIMDKDFLISSQKEIIDGMRKQCDDECHIGNEVVNDLESERERLLTMISSKDKELGELSMIIENMKKQFEELEKNNKDKHFNDMQQLREQNNEIILANNKQREDLLETRKLLKDAYTENESLRQIRTIDDMQKQCNDDSHIGDGIVKDLESERDRLVDLVKLKDKELGECYIIIENLKKQFK